MKTYFLKDASGFIFAKVTSSVEPEVDHILSDDDDITAKFVASGKIFEPKKVGNKFEADTTKFKKFNGENKKAGENV